MSKISEKRKTTHEELTDLVVEGFERLDNNILDKRAPKITWLNGFDIKEDAIKIQYLKKLASTMNNAAKLIQDERDALVQLMVMKEKQLVKMAGQVTQINMVIQDQVTKMNEQRQGFNQEVARQNRTIRELKLENKNLQKEVDEKGE